MVRENPNKSNSFTFSAIVIKESAGFTALCVDLDVASEGQSIPETKNNLLEAVTLYLETSFESNLPHLRPVPPSDDPRGKQPDKIVEEFRLKVEFEIQAHA